MTSGCIACRREISVEKSAAPNLGKNSPTTSMSGFRAFSAAEKICQLSRPQA